MLVELTVRNFAVIQETRIEPGPGLNVITGETGAGKSLLVDALEFVLGERADRELIRGGADKASVEAVFQVPSHGAWGEALAQAEVMLDEDGALVFFREVHREGRSICRINGRAVPIGMVRQVGERLVDIHGQGTHLSLLEPRFQLAVLDAYAGLDADRHALGEAIGEVRRIGDELARLTSEAEQAERRRELLVYQVEEIEAANVRSGEEAELLEQRDLLVHAQAIQEACAEAYETLYEGPANATDLIARALLALRRSPAQGGEIGEQLTSLEAAAAQVQEAAHALRSYAESLEHDPGRLEIIEDRLETLRRLQRKYGGTEEGVRAFAKGARSELEGIENAGERREALEQAKLTASLIAGKMACHLSGLRAKAAGELAKAASRELADLGLARVTFITSLRQTETADGLPGTDGKRYAYGPNGIDEVEFLVETNKGEGLKPLSKVASGGETSRMLLAIKGALRSASGIPTLVFDEVDAGVGGRAGDVVGRKLWSLSRASQVLCVTHLPQIAAYADAHFRVGKQTVEDRTYAKVQALTEAERTAELASMLGGNRSERLDSAARELLERAAKAKGQ